VDTILSWVVGYAANNVLPLILTAALGVFGVRLGHIKTFLATLADALEDERITKTEMKAIVRDARKIIGV